MAANKVGAEEVSPDHTYLADIGDPKLVHRPCVDPRGAEDLRLLRHMLVDEAAGGHFRSGLLGMANHLLIEVAAHLIVDVEEVNVLPLRLFDASVACVGDTPIGLVAQQFHKGILRHRISRPIRTGVIDQQHLHGTIALPLEGGETAPHHLCPIVAGDHHSD